MHSPLNQIYRMLHAAIENNMSSNKGKSNNGGTGSVNLELSFKSMCEHSNDPYSASVRRSSRHDKLEDPLSMFKTWPLGEVPKRVPKRGSSLFAVIRSLDMELPIAPEWSTI